MDQCQAKLEAEDTIGQVGPEEQGISGLPKTKGAICCWFIRK